MAAHTVPLSNILDIGELQTAIDDGYVRVQHHPTLPIKILNYTEKTAYEGHWTKVTRTCRGLIVTNGEPHNVLARPFPKFFNHGQAGAAEIPLEAPADVVDKIDGSLGVLHPVGTGRYAIATRGSFTSEQAIHATELFNRRYPGWEPPPGWTYLFEIVYPGNRIVCDYGDRNDLIGLGAVEIRTGRVHGPGVFRPAHWIGPIADVMPGRTLAEALALPPRPNAEGVVVIDQVTGDMLKIKQEDYVRLHRIVTGLNARTIWEHLVSGEPLADLIQPLPDEFHPWVRTIAGQIQHAVRTEHERLLQEYIRLRVAHGVEFDPGDRTQRAAFARIAAQHPDKWAMFAILDKRDIRGELLKRAKPDGCITPTGRTFTEETA